jgi:hypothetical protein
LLDEHINPTIATIIQKHRSEIVVLPLSMWEDGSHLGDDDDQLLRAARAARLTLVTYDQRTVPALLERWALSEESHSGVIFVNRRTIAQDDISGFAQALIAFWEANHSFDWNNRIAYLRRVEIA